VEKQRNFCEQCGRGFQPLDSPYLEVDCDVCGETVRVLPPSESGGLQVTAGSRFVIPKGFLKVSLDPASQSVLTRPGVYWFVKSFFWNGQPKNAEGMTAFLADWEDQTDKYLEGHQVAAGIDLQTKEGAEELWDRIQTRQDSTEWWAFLRGAFASMAREAIEEARPDAAAWHSYQATLSNVLFFFRQELEDLVWAGYQSNRERASAAARSSADAEAIRRLDQRLEKMTDSELYALANSGEAIAPKIGDSTLSENVLKTIANWHVISRQREREDERHKRNVGLEKWKLRLQGAAIAAPIIAGTVGALLR
jgi:hypothetical protein